MTMKAFLFALMMISTQSFASNCTEQVKAAFQNSYREFNVIKVTHKGEIGPKEDRLYQRGEIWNDEDRSYDLYEVQSSFMVKFIHVALVDEASCRVKNFIEVSFN